MKKSGAGKAALAALLLAGGAAAHAGSLASFSAAFSPASVPAGATATLTYTLAAHDNHRDLNITTALPPGLAVATLPGATNTCGGALTANAGSASIDLIGGNTLVPLTQPPSLFPYGCTVSVKVMGTTPGGPYTATTDVFDGGSPQGGSFFSNLTVTAAAALTPTAVPTLSEWGVILLVLGMAVSAFRATRRKR